jgi:hypothetical protein
MPTHALRYGLILSASKSKQGKLLWSDVADLTRLAVRAGKPKVARQCIEIVTQFFASSQLIATLKSEAAEAVGDYSTAVEALFESPDAIKECGPERTAELLFAAGQTPSEVSNNLAGAFSQTIADAQVQAFLNKHRSRETRAEWASKEASAFIKTRKHDLSKWRGLRRKRLKAFLRERTYERYESFVVDAVQYANQDFLARLLAFTKHRFPQTELEIILTGLINQKTLDARVPKIARFTKWRNYVSSPNSALCQTARSMDAERVLCTTFYRDDEVLLPLFIDHYVKLGVRDFIVVDNGSTHKAKDVKGLSDRANIRIVETEESYSWTFNGTSWINGVLESTCADWHMYVDIDELMVLPFPNEQAKISNLLDLLDADGCDACSAEMVDQFDWNYAEGQLPSSDLADHNLILALRSSRKNILAPYWRASGGPRRYTHLTKTPLVRPASGVRYMGSHNVTPVRVAEYRTVLKHIKIWRDRKFIGASPQEIAMNSKIRDRGTGCIERHIQFASHNDLGPLDRPFVQPVSYDTFEKLGFFGDLETSGHWQDPSKSLNPTGPFQSSDPRFSTWNSGAKGIRSDLNFKECLDVASKFGSYKCRSDIRADLRAISNRISMRLAKYAILSVAAVEVSDQTVVSRCWQRFCDLAVSHSGPECLDIVLEAIRAMSIQDMAKGYDLVKLFRQRSEAAERLYFTILSHAGHWRELREELEKVDTSKDEFFTPLVSRIARFSRDWGSFTDLTWARLKDSGGRRPAVLAELAAIPDETTRREMQDLALKLALQWEVKSSPGALHVALATYVNTGLIESFLDLYRGAHKNLPYSKHRYFGRLFDHFAVGKVWPTVLGIGLSKTGTNSLDKYLSHSGFLCGHWRNRFLGRLVNGMDMKTFDLVSDISVTYFCRTSFDFSGHKLISTERDLSLLEKSFLAHYSFSTTVENPTFESLRNHHRDGVPFGYDPLYRDIHEEIYFRHSSFAAAVSAQQEWVDCLERTHGENLLRLPLTDPNKAARVNDFLKLGPVKVPYPHANRSRK